MKQPQERVIPSDYFNPGYPNSEYLQRKAKSRMPMFAFDYLNGGCIDERGLADNLANLKRVRLNSPLLTVRRQPDYSVSLFGRKFRYPFGIAPVGLQGLMWPNAPEILARAAADLEVPYVLSTVSSASMETIAEIAQGYAWFQFYNPTVEGVRADILRRAAQAGYEVLMVTVDVPTFGYRPKDIRNGLSMPPKMTWRNVLQMLARPAWLLETVRAGKPEMKTLLPYMPPNAPADQLQNFMNETVMGSVDAQSLRKIRDVWQGKLVLKGISCLKDADAAVEIGADGVVVSNHGARQLDAGPNLIESLLDIAEKHGENLAIIYDSGLYSGTDLAKVLACGAGFGLFGRLFVYGVAALGQRGGVHTINMLGSQFAQVAQQLGCASLADFPGCLQCLAKTSVTPRETCVAG